MYYYKAYTFYLKMIVYVFLPAHRELVEELHPLMKEALERRPEVSSLYL